MTTVAFLLGLTGSLHCVGMCGPIALALPVHRRSAAGKIAGVLLYNLGRVSVYAVLGFAVGGIGFLAVLGEWQRWLSVGAGAILVLTAIGAFRGWPGPAAPAFARSWVSAVQQCMMARLPRRGLASLWVMGMLNGLLPCGMVYLALLSAIVSINGYSGALFMAAFGLGTMPAMLATAFAGQWASLSWRIAFKKLTPWLIGVAGVVLVARGLSPGGVHRLDHASGSAPLCVGK